MTATPFALSSGLLIGFAGSSFAQQPVAPSPNREASDSLKLGPGDQSISPHFGYMVEGGVFSGRRIVRYRHPGAQEGRERVAQRRIAVQVRGQGAALLREHATLGACMERMRSLRSAP